MEKKRILLIEDDVFLHEIYVDTLEAEGYEVESAKNGKEGLEKIKQGNWSLILLDITMPDINGLDVARKAHDFPNFSSNSAIVFLSNSDNEKEIEEAKKLGNGYLIKSKFNPDELVAHIKTYLNS